MGEAEKDGGIAARLRRAPLAALFLVILLAWVPGYFTLPPLDRDESRFAQASKQMLETGDFVSIRFGDEARDQKPVGIYWLQSASTAFFGDVLLGRRSEIWTYRVPSLLAGFSALALVFWMVRWFADTRAAFSAALFLGLAVLVWAETKIAKTDAVLLATVLGSQSLLLRSYLSNQPGASVTRPSLAHVCIAWATFGFGILVKGPIVIIICLSTALGVSAWDRRFRWLRALRPALGMLIAAAVVLPWAIAIYIQTDGAFYANSLGRDFALKLAGVQETHGSWPGYYAVLAPLTFWPATLVLLPGLAHGYRQRRAPAVRFLLVWLATTWLMFELAPTKLPHYVLPAYPVLAILGGLWLANRDQGPRPERLLHLISALLFAAVGVGLIGFALWAPYQFGPGGPAWAFAAGGAAIAAVCVAAFAFGRGQSRRGVAVAALAAIITYGIIGFGAVPNLVALDLSSRIAAATAKDKREGDPAIVLAGYSEPSARFLLGTSTVFATGADAAMKIPPQGGVAVVERAEQEPFLAALAERGLGLTPLEIVEGLNYSNGRTLRLFVYRVTPQSIRQP